MLYRILGGHPDLAWFSSFTARFPRWPMLAFFSRFYPWRRYLSLPKQVQRLIPAPSEAYEVWDLCKPVVNSPSDPPLTVMDATDSEKNRIEKMISAHMKYQNRPRFINKNTRNTRRIGYLHALFPDALYIHIVRDPRASVASLMKVPWWPDLMVWTNDGITPRAWEASGKDPTTLAVKLWVEETKLVLENEAMLGERFRRVFYEDLIQNPKDTIRSLLDFCELGWAKPFDKFYNTFIIKDMNRKFKSDLSKKQIDIIETESASIIEQLGRDYF